ncbi:polysaccharide biosynthesis tyrosine autokinase [Microbispora sp. NBC_01389]|uniref:polysaccharide biosynthesis tyrosine autokinase n=1 Tax=Microbispora sp. NBC_01389 TaxID=2903584 RepID=UPI003250AF58
MDSLYYARLVRRNWLVLLLALGIGVGAALAVTARTPPKYVATMTMLLTADETDDDISAALQAGALSAQRVQSYATLLTSRRVVRQAADGDPEALQGNIVAEVVPSTSMLRASVTDTDPARAARAANALGAAFTKVINQISGPAAGDHPVLRITVIDPAETPTAPVSPNPPVNVALGALIALFIGIGSLVLRDRLDTTIKTKEALQQATGGTVLGTVALERDARDHPLIVRDTGRSSRSESFRSLRTNLQFKGVDREVRSLVVTSCLPEEGKSSTAANLAITMAEAGWRVLLVDGDLRRPRLGGYLGIEAGTGLSDVLIQQARLEDVIQTWGRPGLSVLPSGRIPPNPSELLGSRGMGTLLGRLREEYDMVVIDAPPLLPVTDAAALSAVCDGALLVVRHGRTRREHVLRAEEMLSSVGARLVGTVLNFVPVKQDDRYGYAYAPQAAQETLPDAAPAHM